MTSAEGFGRLIDDFRHFVDARGEHHNVNAAEALYRGGNDLVAMRRRARTQIDAFDLGAELFAFDRNFVQRIGPASRNDEITTGSRQHLRGKRAECAGRAGDNRGFAANLEQ